MGNHSLHVRNIILFRLKIPYVEDRPRILIEVIDTLFVSDDNSMRQTFQDLALHFLQAVVGNKLVKQAILVLSVAEI